MTSSLLLCQALAAGLIFWAAVRIPAMAPLAWLYCLLLTGLTFSGSIRTGFGAGLLAGMATFAPHLGFFWTIFGPEAVALWLVLAFWPALFVALSVGIRRSHGRLAASLLVPLLWLGTEYFRSELYYLRFSWLSVGSLFSDTPIRFLYPWLGVYGVGFLVFLLASLALYPERKRATLCCIAGLLVLFAVPGEQAPPEAPQADASVRIAGIQLESPAPARLFEALEGLAADEKPDLVVLPEYTLEGLPPEKLLRWAGDHDTWIVVGGRRPLEGGDFLNTAFVVSPEGGIVFEQVKSVPIQFLRDGQSADSQSLWESPWGPIGICICYDMSYTRVTDELVRQGAQWLIVPAMDEHHWGEWEHILHARLTPVRAAEYRIPVLRVASSGISQLVSSRGRVVDSLGYPGRGLTMVNHLPPAGAGSLPLDRRFAPAGVLALLWAFVILVARCRKRATG